MGQKEENDSPCRLKKRERGKKGEEKGKKRKNRGLYVFPIQREFFLRHRFLARI